MTKVLSFLIAFVFFTAPLQVSAADEKLSLFLKSAAYGTVAGAVLGLATLAWSENPSGKMNNIARGASLGLYAGIGFGLYTVYAPQKATSEYVKNDFKPHLETQLPFQVWLSPLGAQGKIEGLQIHWARFSF